MRHDVKKYLFYGVDTERELFFKKAQEAGIVHFVSQSMRKTEKTKSADVKNIMDAIKILRGLPVVEQEDLEEFEIALGFSKKIITLKNRLNQLNEEERVIKLEMARVFVFGAFSKENIEAIEKLGKKKIQFYCAKNGYAEKFHLPEELIFIDSDKGLDYFLGINNQEMQYPKMIEMFIERPWNILENRHQEIEQECKSIEKRLKDYAKYNKFLHEALIVQLNQYHMDEAQGFVEFPLESGGLFAVQGFVPVNQTESMHKFVEALNVYVEEIGINSKEMPPTCLENEGAARIGEDLVHIYDTPSSRDKDPSLWVLVFFALFFSMIINDGGYGLVFLLMALYVRCKNSNLHGIKKRMLDLLSILGFSCLAWGLLTTSFFGIELSPDNGINRMSFMSYLVEKKAEYHIHLQDAVYQEWIKKMPSLEAFKDPVEFLTHAGKLNGHGEMKYEAFRTFADNIMMELALVVGIIHIILSMCRNMSHNLAYMGWIILIIGGYLYAPSFLNASSMANYVFGINRDTAAHNGLYMIYVGLFVGVVIATFQHKIIGLLETTIVIQIFGDILSYLRLYALGLSGAMVAATVADFAASVPLFFGVIILIVGHVINIALGIMGGLIHGLRLNFLEWYHYCFEGGGKIFSPLQKHEREK